MTRFRRAVNRLGILDVFADACLAILVTLIAVPQIASAAGLAAATYVKLHSVVVKPEGGGVNQYLVRFSITGGSGDTYTTSGVTPSATATGLGFTGFKTITCQPQTVAWTAYATSAKAIVMRSTNVQLANSTSLDGVSFICDAIAY